MNVLALTFNRLHLGFLGCYGNPWVETPNFDRLAARAVVADRHYSHAVDPAESRAPWWGHHVFESLARQNVTVRRLAEAGSLDAPPSTTSEDGTWESIRGADGLEHHATPFARLIDAAVAALDPAAAGPESSAPRLIWAHSTGVPELWIPPEPFASLYFDEVFDVEEAEDSAQVPRAELLEAVDQLLHALHAADAPPDLATQLEDSDWRLLRAVYAGYVTLLDFHLGRLLDALTSASTRRPVLLIVTAANGTALGEQRMRGDRQAPFPEELVHTPLLLRLAGGAGESTRYSGFTQPADIPLTILEALAVPAESSGEARSLWPLLSGQGEVSPREEIRFADAAGNLGLLDRQYAYHRLATSEQTGPHRLYLQPEDIWQVSDVAQQNPKTVETLEARLTQSHPRAQRASIPSPPGRGPG